MKASCCKLVLAFAYLAISGLSASAGAEPKNWSTQAMSDLQDLKAKIAEHTRMPTAFPKALR